MRVHIFGLVLCLCVSICFSQAPEGCGTSRLGENSYFNGLVNGKVTGKVNGFDFDEYYDHSKRIFRRTLTQPDTNATRSYYFFEQTQEIFKIENEKCTREEPKPRLEIGPFQAWTELKEIFGQSSYEFFDQTFSAMSLIQAYAINLKNPEFNSKSFNKGFRLCYKNSFVIEYITKRGYLAALEAIKLYVSTSNGWKSVEYTIGNETPVGVQYWIPRTVEADLIPYGFMCRRKPEIEAMRPRKLSWPPLYKHRVFITDQKANVKRFDVTVDTTTNLEYYVPSETISYIVDKEMDIVFRNDENGRCVHYKKDVAVKNWPEVKTYMDVAADHLWNVKEDDNYLGNYTMYSELYSVYERHVQDFHTDSAAVRPAVITLFVLPRSKSYFYDSEKLQVKTFSDSSRTKVEQSLTIVSSYKETNIDRTATFNILPCLETGPIRRLILKFKSSNNVKVAMRLRKVITKALIDKLATVGVRPIRYRIKDIRRAEDDSVNIFVTLRHAYVNFVTSEMKVVDALRVVTNTLRLDECVAMCQKLDNCNAYSLCGSSNQPTCKLATGQFQTIKSDNCTTGTKTMKTSYPTVDELQKRIETEWLQNGFSLKLDVGGAGLTLNLEKLDVNASDTSQPSSEPDSVFPDLVSMVNNQTSILLRVEKVNLAKKAYQDTKLIEEYYDFVARRGAVKEFEWDTWSDDSLDRTSFYFYDTREYFDLDMKMRTCKTYNVDEPSTGRLSNILFPTSILEAMQRLGIEVAGPSALLRFANLTSIVMRKDLLGIEGYGHVYVGKKTFGDTNFTIYTAQLMMDDNIIHRPLKVQLDVKGEPHTLFTFTSFTPKKEPSRITSLPNGFGCSRLAEVDLPEVPVSNLTNYQLNLELIVKDNEVSPPQQFALNIDAARNLNYGLQAYTMRLNPLKKDVYKVVFDKSKMISYWTQLRTKSCEIQQTGNTVGLKYPKDEDAYNILDPEIVSTRPYDHLGTTTIRNSKVNVFETSLSYTSQRNKARRRAVITLFFRDDTTSSALSFWLPLQIRVRDFNSTSGNQITREFILNVASVTAPIPDPSVTFDISGCFEKPQEYTWFEMSFVSLKSHASLYLNERKLVQKAFYKMLDFIPPTRIPKVLVDISPNTIVITAKLLERTPVEYSYRKLENKQVNKEILNTRSTLTRSVEICGQLCFKSADCVGFSYCPASLECDQTVGKDYSARRLESTALETKECNTYVKTNLTYQGTAGDDTLDSLTSRLEDSVSSAQLLLVLPSINSEGVVDYNDVNNLAEFFAIDIKKNVEPGFNLNFMSTKIGSNPESNKDAQNKLADDILNDYILDQARTKIDFEKVKIQNGRKMLGLSLADCKSLCDNDEFCRSFSFCPSSGECVTAPIKGSQMSSFTVYDDECSLLTKGYLTSYNFINNHYFVENKTVVIARSEEACAEACSNYKDFECLSFDFCRQEKQFICSLYKVHSQVRSSMGGLRYSATCGHYSRKYTYDYKPFPAKKLKSTDLLTVKSVSPDDCAIQCKKENCLAFEYCEAQIFGSFKINDVCRISGPTGVSSDDFETNRNCTVYTKYGLTPEAGLNSGQGSKYATWLGIFMALFALALGGGITVGLIWHKQRGLSTFS